MQYTAKDIKESPPARVCGVVSWIYWLILDAVFCPCPVMGQMRVSRLVGLVSEVTRLSCSLFCLRVKNYAMSVEAERNCVINQARRNMSVTL